MAVTMTATMTTTKINSNRESERNLPSDSASDSFELSSVTGELSIRLVISSESIVEVVTVVSCLLPSLVLKTEAGGMLFVKTIFDVVVVNGTVQEFPIDGSLRSATSISWLVAVTAIKIKEFSGLQISNFHFEYNNCYLLLTKC